MSFNKEGEAQFPVGKKEVFEAVKKSCIIGKIKGAKK